jgi:hypothetical protein
MLAELPASRYRVNKFMSVPFNQSVADAAIEILLERCAGNVEHADIVNILIKSCKGQHPMLIIEHWEYVQQLLGHAQAFALKIQAGAMSMALAEQSLQRGFPDFSIDSIRKLLHHISAPTAQMR